MLIDNYTLSVLPIQYYVCDTVWPNSLCVCVCVCVQFNYVGGLNVPYKCSL